MHYYVNVGFISFYVIYVSETPVTKFILEFCCLWNVTWKKLSIVCLLVMLKMLILYIKKIETYVQKIYLKTKTTTKQNQKPQNANDKVIIEEKWLHFHVANIIEKLYIIYYILLYFPKGYSIYHTKQTVVTHLFTGRKQIISIHVNYIKTFIHIYILWYACTFLLSFFKSTDRICQIITCFHNYKITHLRALL